MSRPKRTDPIAPVVRAYLRANYPALSEARLAIHRLDGPPGGPRYAASVEVCRTSACPYHVSSADAQAGACPVLNCRLRTALRLLLDSSGSVLTAQTSHIHWQ